MVTYNSQGLVRKTESLNSSQVKLISQPGSDSSLDSSQQEEIVPKLFTGYVQWYPPLSDHRDVPELQVIQAGDTVLGQHLHHGLKANHQVEKSIIMAKLFHSHNYYTRAMVNPMDVLSRLHTMLDTGHFVRLVSDVSQRLGSEGQPDPPAGGHLGQVGVPHHGQEEGGDVSSGAKNMIKKTRPTIAQSSVSVYK
jgi:hypothetical protein